jgi:hypothetical protein
MPVTTRRQAKIREELKDTLLKMFRELKVARQQDIQEEGGQSDNLVSACLVLFRFMTIRAEQLFDADLDPHSPWTELLKRWYVVANKVRTMVDDHYAHSSRKHECIKWISIDRSIIGHELKAIDAHWFYQHGVN